jgi:acetylornithine deacetylase/succinyl-diaminopimelate desuccinylase-like protein
MGESFQEEEIVHITQRLIRCRSVNPPPDTTGCARVVAEILEENEIKADVIEGGPGVANVVCRLKAVSAAFRR